MDTREFQELIWEQGRVLYRSMPWRDDTRPYYVMVSEIMLQQTQVSRVVPKFEAFIAQFPSIESLAEASLADVLTAWSGLGYNRRAKFLHQAAQKVVQEYGGEMPATLEGLMSLPGVGINTAGAIMAYSYNHPVVFIETNIRTVYFHHFFADEVAVTDKALREVVEETIDSEHPREWYWAMMDYGSFLKQQGQGRLDQSHHYKKQAPLKGSLREVRGQIIAQLAKQPLREAELRTVLSADNRFETALSALIDERLVARDGDELQLAR